MDLNRGIFTAVALVLLIGVAWISMQQFEIMIYKFALVACAGVLGYWVDILLFPHFRPEEASKKLKENAKDGHSWYILAASIQIRRALIILAVIMGVSLGL